MTAMSINNPKHWQERATEMRVVAQAIDDQRAREEMLKVANDYERMAKRAHAQSVSLPVS